MLSGTYNPIPTTRPRTILEVYNEKYQGLTNKEFGDKIRSENPSTPDRRKLLDLYRGISKATTNLDSSDAIFKSMHKDQQEFYLLQKKELIEEYKEKGLINRNLIYKYRNNK